MADQVFVGIEIGGTKLQVLVEDSALQVLLHERAAVVPGDGAAGIRQQLTAILGRVCARWQPAAVGVGFGGPVNADSGKVLTSHQVGGWASFDLKHWLESHCNAPVSVDNDANVAALGEAVRGAGVGVNRVFYITLGSGVGGGLVVGNDIYHGAPGGEAEIGQVKIDRQGTTLEACCSGWALDEQVRNAIVHHPGGVLARLGANAKAGEAMFLGEALAQGDVTAQKIVTGAADTLAFALSHVVHLFHPDVIVVGGGLSKLGAPLVDAVGRGLASHVMAAFLPPPPVVSASLGEHAVPVGAIALAQRVPVSD